jgi:transmembrane sensor
MDHYSISFMPSSRLHYLFSRYLDNTATESEEAEFLQLAEKPENKAVLQTLLGRFVQEAQPVDNPSAAAEEAMLKAIFEVRPPGAAAVVKGHFRWWRQIAAAVLVLVLAGSAWFMLRQGGVGDDPAIADLPQEQRFKNDISPARQQVLITLADGSTTILDSALNGTIAKQGETNVVKQDSSISYINNNSVAVFYNTVSTGKGRVVSLKLADGTRVWLDAQSSIHFPTAFPGNERVVEIKGQAYFEVHSSTSLRTGKRVPFKVKAGEQTIEVLGTHFNVNAYYAENVRTTLLEGSVRLTQNLSRQGGNAESLILKPGQQATIDDSRLTIHDNIDPDEVMAWKNSRFQFNESSVEEIMNQLSRWYDIEVVYKDQINKAFVAKISRDMPVSKLLGLLEMTKQIKFSIEGKKIIVMKW